MGDSIYLGSGSDADGPNTNILIDGNTLVNPFRNNVSFIYSSGVAIINNVTIKLNTFVINYDIEPNNSAETNYDIEIAYNQDGIPPRLLNTVGNSEYDNVADISCNAAGGNYWFHDEAIFAGGDIEGRHFGPGSFGQRWYRGTSCANYSNINVDAPLL